MTNNSLVVITGASHGIGEALAKKFHKKGHPLLLLSRHIESIPGLTDEKVMYAQVDVINYQEFQTAVGKAEKKYGKTECMINNAGFLNVGELRDMSVEQCTYEMDVLIKGVLNGIKIVLSDMSSRNSGTIINISSIGDRRPYPQAVIYHASKHAVRSMSESLQMAEGKNNVRIMNIAPALIKTEIHKSMGISFQEYCELLGHPDFINPEELANIIMYCWELPQHICIRDILIAPTNTSI
ncbi:SDR family oxidoreductase [Legionella israelensis]|uniref:SDR family oxidoreductase n=1 Tax=Legionella israelensis TaxID=454 RepID=A0A0W0WMS8_9GAMM|nr:SDR family oxidoreductase [Legionella israelensis]KTD33636.1 short chain dehydrogenase/reductase family oxidoreductase [Legionella israelensis]QBR84478.1 SDR family oxidoreductase [Legionella israelensis]QBS08783.1 SDR family oxidoreductase [Legionella israelensis]SCY12259.1 NADP-dependent 3-hydroxy acid dehydrogenase YdfG [Legionella israelensis DSM 19235]STX58460.1 short chain dehydrogenase/reductase family oxidoreductase [Legionella israelensis]